MAEFKIKKMDARYNGHRHFSHLVDYGGKYGGSLTFQQHRAWLWNTYGPSCEIEAWIRLGKHHTEAIDCISNEWAWNTEFGNRKLYIGSDEALACFTLKFSA